MAEFKDQYSSLYRISPFSPKTNFGENEIREIRFQRNSFSAEVGFIHSIHYRYRLASQFHYDLKIASFMFVMCQVQYDNNKKILCKNFEVLRDKITNRCKEFRNAILQHKKKIDV